MNSVNHYPTAAAREKAACAFLPAYSSYLDLLDGLLSRARSMASTLGVAANAGEKYGINPEDLAETAFALRDQIEAASSLLQSWYEDTRQATAEPAGGEG